MHLSFMVDQNVRLTAQMSYRPISPVRSCAQVMTVYIVLFQEIVRLSKDSSRLTSLWHFDICYVEANSVTPIRELRIVRLAAHNRSIQLQALVH
jgi:hypothetical protein